MAGCGRYAALVRRGHRRHGGRLTTARRASRLSSSSEASARGAGSQRYASSGIKSPPVRVLALASGALGASESNAHLEVYGLGCCPYIMPRQSSEAQNTRAFALDTPGSPPRAVSVGCLWRCRSWCAPPYNPHVFQSGAVRRPVPLDGRVDQAATTTSHPWDVAMERSTSRTDPERETAPSWALRWEKPSP